MSDYRSIWSRPHESGSDFDDHLGPEAFAAGVRTFSRIADYWQLTREERMRLLAFPDDGELDCALTAPECYCTDERLERLSLVFGIWRYLGMLLPNQVAADSWLRRPNSAPPFAGRPAADLLTTGRLDDLKAVNRYLVAQVS